MKRMSLFICLMLIGIVNAVAEAPLVSNVEAHQRTDGSKIVDIFYDVSDSDSTTLSVSLKISNDGGQTYSIFPQTISGDVGSGVSPGNRKHIVWDAGKDLPGAYGTEYRAAVTASDGGGGEEITVPITNLYAGAKPLEMVHIPAGTFLMGSPSFESDRDSYEGPQHQVTISKDLYLGKYEVTQAQYEAVVGSNPSSGYGLGPNYPVYYVSWYDAVKFCNKLSQMDGRTPVYYESSRPPGYDESIWAANLNADGYRLPTEAEWEYVCRAGTETRFYWGDDPSYTDIKDYCWCSVNNSLYKTKEVGQKIPNAFGLFDMSGNVREWCYDCCESYSSNSQTNPEGPSSGGMRVDRGGSWWGGAQSCRSASRGCFFPGDRYYEIGFRLLRSYP